MTDQELLLRGFEAHREHLRAVAYRMLGSASDVEDALQEAWIRLSHTPAGGIENIGGWLTTVVGRVCLDMLRARKSRRAREAGAEAGSAPNPEEEAMLADSVGEALLVVLDTLTPSERLAFVLHDTFEVSYDEIGLIIGKTPAAARQLASRARRRVRGAPVPRADLARRWRLVNAFLAASRDGNFEALLTLLDPEVTMRADDGAVAIGAALETRGADAVAAVFAGRAQIGRPKLVDGEPALVWAPGGKARVIFKLSIEGDRVVEVVMVADQETIAASVIADPA